MRYWPLVFAGFLAGCGGGDECETDKCQMQVPCAIASPQNPTGECRPRPLNDRLPDIPG